MQWKHSDGITERSNAEPGAHPAIGMRAAASAERSKAQSSHLLEILGVAGRELKSTFERRRRDQGVGKPEPELPGDAPGALRDRSINRDLAEGSQQACDERAGGGAGEQLRSRDDRVVQAVPSWLELCRASQVIDEDVGVDEQVSHGATCPAKEPSRWGQPRRWR